jgi:histidine triad (HIT) family protein
MTDSYDSNNIFAKILREEIPSKLFYENDFIKVFHDINPEAPIHLLMIPRGPYRDFYHFISSAIEAEIKGFFKGVEEVIKKLSLEEGGYRLITNAGATVGQTIFHFHLHLLAGKKFSSLVA